MGKMITTRDSIVQELVEASSRRQPVVLTWEQVIAKNWADLKRKSNGISPRPMPTLPVVNNLFSDIVADGAWRGQRCFIVGGGASLRGFEFSQLTGEAVIAVNRAYEVINAQIMFAIDAKLHKWITDGKLGAEAKKRFEEFGGHKVWLDSHRYSLKGVTKLMGLDGTGLSFSMKRGLKHGGNSGYAALNLAVCLGASPIYLLGFDMKGIGGKQAHWHDGYPKVQPDKVYAKFKTYFESAAPILRKRGIRVVNLNPDSALKCFEFGKLEDIENLAVTPDYIPKYDSKKVIPSNKKNLFFEGCLGFGDNFYQRQIIKEVAKTHTVYLKATFPEVYWDIPNVKFLYPASQPLRTQKKHIESLPAETWSKKPGDAHRVRWQDIGPPATKKIQTKYVELENSKDFDFSFPVKNEWVEEAKKLVKTLPLKGKKFCIIRRPTNRREWNCPARNPKIEYYQLLIDKYKDEYFFLGLADIKPKEEWFDGVVTGLDKEFNKGEIPLTTILGLMKISDMIITYPSFFMIAAVALRAKCFCIWGGISAPHYSLRKNLGLQNFSYVAAEPFCSCHTMNHKCKKDIPMSRILSTFKELKDRPKWHKSVTVGVPPGMGDSHWVMAHMESFKERHGIDELKVAVMKEGLHNYTADILRLYPFIDEVKEQRMGFNLDGLYRSNPPKFMLKNTQGVDYFIDFGALMWLKGMKLEEIYPECTTNFTCLPVLPEESLKFAKALKKKNDGKLVLFYTSSVGNNENWNRGAWMPQDWVTLADYIFKHSGIQPVLIGAKWDRDYTQELHRLSGGRKVMQDLVGETSGSEVLSLAREADLVVSFACGIPMMATYWGVPTVMFWATKGVSRKERFNPEFQYAWVPPKARGNGRYIPVAYDSREANPTWIFNKVKEFL